MIKRTLLLALGLVVIAGCKHAPAPTEDTGRSAFAFVDPPAGPPPEKKNEAVQAVDRSQWREATLKEPFILPVYPPRALKAKAGRNTVGVHILVDPQGHVSEIRMSMLVFSTPGPFADDFRDAVELAVRQWRFNPARAEHFEVVTEKGFTYQRVTKTENVETEFDLAFTFQPDGRVEQGGDADPERLQSYSPKK